MLVAFAIAATLAAPPAGPQIQPVLQIAKSTAPVGEDVPYTITVTPATKAKGKRARVQVKGRVTWQGIDTFRIPRSGRISDDVEGYEPGLGRYRVLVLGKNGVVVAKSGVVSVTWTPRVTP
jgi:hypothetical protein